jgi:hypothetical protein
MGWHTDKFEGSISAEAHKPIANDLQNGFHDA